MAAELRAGGLTLHTGNLKVYMSRIADERTRLNVQKQISGSAFKTHKWENDFRDKLSMPNYF